MHSAGEQAVDKSDAVEQVDPESDAEQPASDAQDRVEMRQLLLAEGKRQGDGGRDDHHAGNRSDAEQSKVYEPPDRLANLGQHQQRHGCGAGEPVHDADDQRPQPLVHAEPTEGVVEPCLGSRVLGVSVTVGTVPMPVPVGVVSMRVHVGVRTSMSRQSEHAVKVSVAGGLVAQGSPEVWYRRPLREAPRHAGQCEDPENDQHHGDREFHGKPYSRRDRDIEQDDGAANGEDRQRVADAPGGADQRRAADAGLAAHDGGDRDDVVGVGGVTHAENEAEGDDGEEVSHELQVIVMIFLSFLLFWVARYSSARRCVNGAPAWS